MALAAIKPNQVRAFTNASGHRSYYLVVQDGKGKIGAMWFRNKENSPLHLSWSFKVSEEHDLIMNDVNSLRDVFAKIDEEQYGDGSST